MDLTGLQAIIFDAEGVVVDTESLWDRSQEILLARHGLDYDRESLKPKMAGKTLKEGAQIMIDHYGIRMTAVLLADERNEIIHRLFEEKINFIDGFLSFFGLIESNQLRRCIATSMQKSLMEKVDARLHLKRLFEGHIYHIEDVGNKSKPQPDVFLFAANRLGVLPEHCLVIEDSPNGIEAASRAGMKCAGLATTFAPELLQQAGFVAQSFEDITDLLRKMYLK